MGKRARLAGVGALLVISAAAATHPAASAQEPPRFGLNDPILFHDEDPEIVLDAHQAIGATLQRAVIPWRTVQPQQGAWDWHYVDKVIGLAERRGMGTIALLHSPPPWASTDAHHPECFMSPTAARCQRPPAPARLGDLQVFVQELARRYPSLVAIEVFNEPNLGTWNWQPAADPEYYTRVLEAVHAAVEAVRPELPVLSGGIGEPPHPVPEGSMPPGEFLERMYRAGARRAMDGIGVHPYPANTSPTDPATSNYHRLMAKVTAIRNQHRDGGTPLWITETGYTNTGPFGVTVEQQARWLPAILRDAFGRSDVAAVVIHTLRDFAGSSDNPESGYGLLYGDFSAKPVFHEVGRTVGVERQRRLAEARRKARAERAARRSRRCKRSSRRATRDARSRRKASRRCACRSKRRCKARRKSRASRRDQAVTRGRE